MTLAIKCTQTATSDLELPSQTAQAFPRLSFRLLKAMPAMAPSSKPDKGDSSNKAVLTRLIVKLHCYSFPKHPKAHCPSHLRGWPVGPPATSPNNPPPRSPSSALTCSHDRHSIHAVQCTSLGLVAFLFRLLLLLLPFGELMVVRGGQGSASSSIVLTRFSSSAASPKPPRERMRECFKKRGDLDKGRVRRI